MAFRQDLDLVHLSPNLDSLLVSSSCRNPKMMLHSLLLHRAMAEAEPNSRYGCHLINQAVIKFIRHLALTFGAPLTLPLHSKCSPARSARKTIFDSMFARILWARTSNCIFVALAAKDPPVFILSVRQSQFCTPLIAGGMVWRDKLRDHMGHMNYTIHIDDMVHI